MSSAPAERRQQPRRAILRVAQLALECRGAVARDPALLPGLRDGTERPTEARDVAPKASERRRALRRRAVKAGADACEPAIDRRRNPLAGAAAGSRPPAHARDARDSRCRPPDAAVTRDADV